MEGKCVSEEGQTATAGQDCQHPSVGSPTHLQSLTPRGALEKPDSRLRKMSIWVLMVCVHSSWVLACASQRMCEAGTVLVRQGVCNRPRWGFGKKSIREGGKKVLPCHQGAFGTFSSPSSPYRPLPHHTSSCLPLSLGSGEGWGQRT